MKMNKMALAMALMYVQSTARAGADTIEMSYATQDDIPAQYVDLFSEKDGKWVLTGVKGMKTQDDINRQLTANQKIRDELKTAKAALSKFGNMDPDEVITKLDRIEELEAQLAAGGKPDESKINELVEARIKARLTPIEREKERLARELAEKDKQVTEYSLKDRRRLITDQLRTAATKANVRSTALEDILLIGQTAFEITEDGVVQTTDGMSAEVWLTEQQNNRPHWWPESSGAGANGGSGGGGNANPFSNAHWNLTEQGKLVRANPAKAEQMAKAAGTTVGGKRPAK